MNNLPINVSELDFAQIKNSLRDFLRTQKQFEDYDFEGSGLSVLLDVLSVNTLYNAYYLHMVANEMFLDSAVWRKNVVSRAKAIGYVPNSKRSSVAYVTIELVVTGNPSSVTIPERTKFVSTVDGKAYIFETRDSHLAYPFSGNRYRATNVPIYEGVRLTHRFVVDNQNYTPQSRFTIPNAGCDTTLLKVAILPNETSQNFQYYKNIDNFTEVTGETPAYWIQETDDNKFEVYFGDGYVGKPLTVGNVVSLDYVVSSGEAANSFSTFSSGNIAGFSSKVITETVSNGGMSEETIESIKFLAPYWYQAQNRAVTDIDYETIIKKTFPNVDAVRVWGGQDNVPAVWGKVFVSIKPKNTETLSPIEKEYVSNVLVKEKNVLTVGVNIIDPDYLYIGVRSTVKFSSGNTNDPVGNIREAVKNAIIGYGERELDKFDSVFRYSKLLTSIDSSHLSVKSSLTDIYLKYVMRVVYNVEERRTFSFSNSIKSNKDAPSITSTTFVYLGFTCQYEDDGKGGLSIYRIVDGKKIIVKANAGTVDYATGQISLSLIAYSSTPNNNEQISFYADPLDDDIRSVRNQIIRIDSNEITLTMQNEFTF